MLQRDLADWVQKMKDAGAWHGESVEERRKPSFGSTEDGVIFAGASTGIYYSEDRGRTWTRARTGLPERSPGIAFLVEGTFILAGTETPEAD